MSGSPHPGPDSYRPVATVTSRFPELGTIRRGESWSMLIDWSFTLERAALATGQMHEPFSITISRDHTGQGGARPRDEHQRRRRARVKTTAGPVTSAAVVMVALFAILPSLGALEFKQLGVGLAAAILIDATLIRVVLLPATMTVLGDANWYLPRSLHRAARPRQVAAPAHSAG